MGGDVAKAVLAGSGEKRKAAITATVILDQLIGISVMLTIGTACLLPLLGRLENYMPAYLLLGLLIAMIAEYTLYVTTPLR